MKECRFRVGDNVGLINLGLINYSLLIWGSFSALTGTKHVHFRLKLFGLNPQSFKAVLVVFSVLIEAESNILVSPPHINSVDVVAFDMLSLNGNNKLSCVFVNWRIMEMV